MALVTQAQLERHLQITFGDPSDPVVAEYLAQAQAAAEAWCRQPLEYATGIVETFEADQPYQAWKVLKRFPVTAAPTTVVERTVTLTVTTDYRWYEDGRLRRVSGESEMGWSTEPDAVVVTYNAGYGTGAPAPYTTIPDDLALGIIVYAGDLFRHGAAFAAQGSVPVSSITLEGSDTIQYAVNSQPATTQPLLSARSRQLLAPYARRIM